MFNTELTYNIFSHAILIDVLVFIFLPTGENSLWYVADNFLYNIFSRLEIFFRGHNGIMTHQQWLKNSDKRRSVLQFFLSGLILICAFPLWRHFGTEYIIDGVWNKSEIIKNILKQIFTVPASYFSSNNWRQTEYDLWEICVFLWTGLLVGIRQGREIKDYLKTVENPGDLGYKLGSLHMFLLVFLVLIGSLTLIISAVSLYRVLFEALLILFLGIVEGYIAREYYKRDEKKKGKHALEIVMYVEIPAFIAFVALFVFVQTSEGYSVYTSHWSHAFVAGASALDLLVANISLVIIGLLHAYED